MADLGNLDLNLLRVFDAVARERHVTRAAERLNLSQPAVSNALARLRHALGDELFLRRPGGVEPTALALSLAQPVAEALDLIAEAIGSQAPFDPGNHRPRLRRRLQRICRGGAGAAAARPHGAGGAAGPAGDPPCRPDQLGGAARIG